MIGLSATVAEGTLEALRARSNAGSGDDLEEVFFRLLREAEAEALAAR